MELDGLDALFAKLEDAERNIDDDVDRIVKNNTIEMTGQTISNERSRFNKGYWTGHTMRNTKAERLGHARYQTFVGSEYAGYLNYGTRFMDPTWFLRDAYYKQRDQLLIDLDRLVK